MSELKPCPFCGCAPDVITRPDNAAKTEFFAAVRCYCDGYSARAYQNAQRNTQDEATAEAIAAWNRRAQPAAPAEQEISAEEKFCDGHCSWAEHHPDCSLSAPPAQPVAHLWQHGETGRTRIVMPDQIFTADANWLLVGPMYLHPAAAPSVAPEPVAWTLQSELDAAQTTCSAHLWFTNPRNSAWTALFTREKIAAHPPRAPLTEEQKRDLVKECDLDWQRGYMPLFEGDPTNRYAVLIEAVEAAHGIGCK